MNLVKDLPDYQKFGIASKTFDRFCEEILHGYNFRASLCQLIDENPEDFKKFVGMVEWIRSNRTEDNWFNE